MGPLPHMKARGVRSLAMGRTVEDACPYRLDFLPVEVPYLFAVFFEAAKTKSAFCFNRVCLAKNGLPFFACNTRSWGFLGELP